MWTELPIAVDASFSFCDRRPWSTTLIFEIDLHSAEMSHLAGYLVQSSFSSEDMHKVPRHCLSTCVKSELNLLPWATLKILQPYTDIVMKTR